MKKQEYIEQARTEYKKLIKVFCPYLKSEVNCSSKGFNHLIYKSDRTRRSESEIKIRLESLLYLSEIISNSGTLQEIDNLDNEQIFYAFIAIIDSRKYKVVISNSKNGEYIFRSIIPKCRTGKRDKKLETKNPSLLE
jgi:hypothetical protein